MIEANNNFSASLPVPLGLVFEYFSFVLSALSGMLHSLYIPLSVLVCLFLCQSISLTLAHKHSDDRLNKMRHEKSKKEDKNTL